MSAWASPFPKESMTADTITLWLSSGKPLTAVLIGDCNRRATWIGTIPSPDSSNSPPTIRESITLGHLLTHTAGLQPSIPAALAAIGAIGPPNLPFPVEPGWVVGETASYDPWNSWFILGDIVQRLLVSAILRS
ncbi:MAG: serine hydrolase [Planctomycetaceae bacterium]